MLVKERQDTEPSQKLNWLTFYC